MSEDKKNSLTFWLWIVFGVSVLVRFYLAIKTGVINTYHDEPVYWDWSRALLHGEALTYRGIASPVKDILYPLILSVAHMFRDFDSAYHTILLINVLLMSSIVFPSYFLAKAVSGSRKQALLIALVSAILPELFYSAKLMQECIYFPYVVWMFWLFFAFLLKDKYSLLRGAVFSVLLCPAFYMKGIGYCFVLAFFLFYAVQIIFCGTFRQKIKSGLLLLESVGICLAIDHVIVVYIEKLSSMSLDKMVVSYLNSVSYKLFGYTNYSLVQLVGFALAGIAALLLLVTVLKYCGKKLCRFRWSPIVFQVGLLFLMAGAGLVLHYLGYLRPTVTYVVFSCIFWGVFPVILPLIYIRELSEKERDFLLFILLLWLFTLAASCFSTLIVAEEVSPESIRIHYRYFFYPEMGFSVLFLALCDRIKDKEKIKVSVIWNVLCILLLIVVTPARQGSMVDVVPLYGMQAFLNSAKGVLLLHVILIVYLLWGNWMLWKRHIKGLYLGVFFLMGGLYLASMQGVYRVHAEQKQILAGKNRDGERLAEYFADKEISGDASSILIVGDAWINSTETTEVHLDVPYRYCLWKDLTSPEVLVNGEIQGGILNLYTYSAWPYRLEGYSAPPYIVSLHPIALAGYEIEQIGLEEYYLYVRSGA